MRVAVVTFPGSNSDHDAVRAAERAGAEAFIVWHTETDLRGADLVVLPGGFSYGDYLRAGAIAGFSPVMQAVRRHADEGGLVLGICNGFQILCEAHMLPGALLRNAHLTFLSRPVALRVERTSTPFTTGFQAGAIVTLPVAHGDGRFTADDETLARLEGEGRVVLRYVRGEGASPNGSANDIAGICNEHGNVVGMMPHPERAFDPVLGAGGDGLAFFTAAVAAVAGGSAAGR
jgi:phosphoribosylformylglycinamidine synthase